MLFFSQWVGEESRYHGQPLLFIYCSLVPPCGSVRHYTVGFTTALMNDQDMSVLFHCAFMNFAQMSTFPKAPATNKEICPRSVNGFCVPLMVILSSGHVPMNLHFARHVWH